MEDHLHKIKCLNGILENPLLGMLYGSQKSGSDLDIFLIYGRKVEKNIFSENYDLNQVSLEDFKFKLFHRDIEYTEPILTGNYFSGDKEILENSIDFIKNKKPEKRIFDYLGKRSIETFLQAENLYISGKNEFFIKSVFAQEKLSNIKNIFFKDNLDYPSDLINKSLSLLTYSLSYLSSIKRYDSGENYITLKKIIENPMNEIENNFLEIKNYFKSCSNSKKPINFKEIDTYFLKSKNLLRRFL